MPTFGAATPSSLEWAKRGSNVEYNLFPCRKREYFLILLGIRSYENELNELCSGSRSWNEKGTNMEIMNTETIKSLSTIIE